METFDEKGLLWREPGRLLTQSSWLSQRINAIPFSNEDHNQFLYCKGLHYLEKSLRRSDDSGIANG